MFRRYRRWVMVPRFRGHGSRPFVVRPVPGFGFRERNGSAAGYSSPRYRRTDPVAPPRGLPIAAGERARSVCRPRSRCAGRARAEYGARSRRTRDRLGPCKTVILGLHQPFRLWPGEKRPQTLSMIFGLDSAHASSATRNAQSSSPSLPSGTRSFSASRICWNSCSCLMQLAFALVVESLADKVDPDMVLR